MNYILNCQNNKIYQYSYIENDYYVIEKDLFKKNKIESNNKKVIAIGIPLLQAKEITRIYKLKKIIKK